MTSNPKEEQTHKVGLPPDGANDISASDGHHSVDGFEVIGVLARRILSRAYQARKRTEDADEAASSVSSATTLGGYRGIVAIHNIADPKAAATVMKGARAQLNSTPIVRNGCCLDEQPNENF